MNHRYTLFGGLDIQATALGEALKQRGDTVEYVGEANHEFGQHHTPVAGVDQRDWFEAIEALPRIRFAVLLPGWCLCAPFMETTAADWDEAIEQNFERTVYAAQACANRWKRDGDEGRLIFVTAYAALMPFAEASAMGTTLAAIHGLARMAAVDLAPYGITSNVIAPGWMTYGHLDRVVETMHPHIRAGIPRGRPTTPAQVAAAIRFLCSRAARGITGAILPVDGGYTLTRSEGRGMFKT